MRLGGELVGYEIHKQNGEVIHHEFETPIKNTVTKHCLNNMLMYNGTNALGPAFAGFALFVPINNSETRTGVFNYCAYGSGTGSTSTDDSDLKNRLIAPISTKRQSGSYYNCSRIGTDDKTQKVRITHKFQAVAEPTSINEIGWFHRVEPSGAFTMSARVLLDDTISLDAGDTFECTYQFTIVFDWTPSIIKNFFNGFDVRKCANVSGISNYNVWQSTDDDYNCFYPFSNVAKNGMGTYFWRGSYSGITGSDRGATAKTAVFSLDKQVDNYGEKTFGPTIAPLLSSFSLPTNFNNANKPNTNSYIGMCTMQIKNYVMDSFYREYTITCNDLWCDNKNVYGMAHNGEIYQFGHEVDGTFTPAPIHKDSGKTWTITFRQSWSTEYLQPTT